MNAHSARPIFQSIADTRLTPGAYMRDCRERAGFTRGQVAEIIASSDGRDIARHDLERLEADIPGDYGRLVTCLRESGAFSFDYATFIALAAETCDPSLDPDAAA